MLGVYRKRKGIEGDGKEEKGIGNEKNQGDARKYETHDECHFTIKSVTQKMEQDKECCNNATKKENEVE